MNFIQTKNNIARVMIDEPTWKKGIFEDAWNYEILGSAFGDLAWKEFNGAVVEKPDRLLTQDIPP